MFLYLGAWVFAAGFIVGGVWTCSRLSARAITENAATDAQRAQVTILADAEGPYIEGSCEYV